MSTVLIPVVPPGRYRKRLTQPGRLSVATFVWAEVVLLLWWAGTWPGLLSIDSRRYVIHVTTGPWVADHSVLYDSMILASLKLSGNVALLTFVQATAAAALLTYASWVFRAVGVPARWAVAPAFVLPFVPSFAASVVTLWKDVPFAMVEVLVALTTIRILRECRRAGRFSLSRGLMWALGVELTLLCLFRNDGFLMMVIVVVALLIGLRDARRQILVLTAVALVVFAGSQRIVYPALHIKPASSSLVYGVFYGDIALAYAQYPHEFTAQDRALMTQVAPLSVWASSDNCFTSDPLFSTAQFDRTKADKVRNQLAGLWFRTLARTPVSTIKGRLCRGAIAWSVLPPPSGTPFGTLVQRVPDDLYSGQRAGLSPQMVTKLRYQPLLPGLGSFEIRLRGGAADTGWQMLTMRGALWCYLLYAAVLLAARRFRRWDILLIAAMPLANQLTVTAANPAQLYRYMLGPLFVGMILMPLFALRTWRSAPAAVEPVVATGTSHP